MAVRRGSPFSGPSLPRSSTFLRKHWPSWVTIIRVDSSSLKAQILLLCEGMLYFLTARSPSPWRSKSLAKNLPRKKWDSHTWIINSYCNGWFVHLPLLLGFTFLFFFHDSCVRCLVGRLRGSEGHVDTKDVDCAVVRCRSNEFGVATELQIINFRFISTTAEHKWIRWVRCIHFPNSNQRALFTSRCKQVTRAIESHGCDWTLVAHNDCFGGGLVWESSHLHMALLCVGDRQHTLAFTV